MAKILNHFGFSLVELSIVLLITGLLIAGAAQLTANMQKQRGDQAQANQMRTVITALERFLSDQQGALAGQLAAGGAGQLLTALNVSGVQAQNFFQQHYLPGTINLNGYTIGVARLADIGGTNGTVNLRGLVLYQPSNPLDDSRLARISTLIGAEGGMISNTATTPFNVNGAFGAWNVNPSVYRLTGTAGRIAAYTTTQDAQINTNLLSRVATGNPEANKMETNLNLGGNVASDAGVLGFRLTTAAPGMVCDSGVLGIYNADGATYANPAYPLDSTFHNAIVTGRNGSSVTGLYQCLQAIDGSSQWEWQQVQALACGGTNQQWGFVTSGPYSGQGKQVDDNRALPPASLFRAGNPFSLTNTSNCDWVVAFNVQNTGCNSSNFNAGVKITAPQNTYLGTIEQDSPGSYHGNSNTNRNVIEFIPPGATASIYYGGCPHNSYVYNIMVYR